VITNPKAGFNYTFVEKLTAGVELLGFEVKSVLSGKGTLEGAYVTIRGGEAWLRKALIRPFQEANTPAGYDEHRDRRLLLTKREITELAQSTTQGLTIIPISLYNKGRIKLDIALAKRKKNFDKRETIKKRDLDRDERRRRG
jgi:SsrA-binding protein